MAYQKTNFISGVGPAIDSVELNKLGQGIEDVYKMAAYSPDIRKELLKSTWFKDIASKGTWITLNTYSFVRQRGQEQMRVTASSPMGRQSGFGMSYSNRRIQLYVGGAIVATTAVDAPLDITVNLSNYVNVGSTATVRIDVWNDTSNRYDGVDSYVEIYTNDYFKVV